MSKKMSKMHRRVNMAVAEKSGNDELLNFLKQNENPNRKPNDFWDQAESFYQQTIQQVTEVSASVLNEIELFKNNPDGFAKCKDQTRLVNLIISLGDDTGKTIQMLNQIHDKHLNKTGGTETPDDNMELILINDEYRQAMDIFQGTIPSLTGEILEIIGYTARAIQILSEEQKNKDMEKSIAAKAKELAILQDPNVISDINVAEVNDE